MSQAIYSLDFSILDAIQESLRTVWLDTVVPYLTMLGDAGLIWILLTVILLCIPGKRKIGLTMAAGLVVDLILCNGLLKPLVARIRPYDLHPGITLLIKAPTDYSFPSGHTSASFTAVFALVFRKDRLWIPALVLALVIAFTRLYLYVHYPSDVFCGILVGLLSGWLGWKITRRWADPLLDRTKKQ